MNRRLVAIFIISLLIVPVFSAVSTAKAISINEEKIENNIYFNQLPNRERRRFWFFGSIYNLTIKENDTYLFKSKNIWKVYITHIDRREKGWEIDIEFNHHLGNISLVFGGYKFFGIIKPNFIFGCFHNKWY